MLNSKDFIFSISTLSDMQKDFAAEDLTLVFEGRTFKSFVKLKALLLDSANPKERFRDV